MCERDLFLKENYEKIENYVIVDGLILFCLILMTFRHEHDRKNYIISMP